MAANHNEIYTSLIVPLHSLLECSGIAILVTHGQLASVVAQSGPCTLPDYIELDNSEQQLVERLARTQQPLAQPLGPHERLPLPAPAVDAAWIGAPIATGGRTYGCVSLVGQFQPGHERVVAALAQQAASTIEWAERCLAAEHAAAQAQHVRDREPRAQQGPGSIDSIERVLDEAVAFTGASHGCVLVNRNGRAVALARRGYSQDDVSLLQQIPPSLDRGLTGRAYQTRRATRSDDVPNDPTALPALANTRSQLVIPIYSGEQTLGLIDLQSPQPSAFRHVDDIWIDTMSAVAAHALERRVLHSPQVGQSEVMPQHDIVLSSRLAVVTDLAAGVAHEINNPLTTILGYTHLLLRNPSLPQAARDDVAQIMVEGQRIAALVERFLRFAQPTSNGKRPLAITEPLTEALGLLKSRLQESGTQIDISAPPEPPIIVGQASQLEQVFVDLLQNGIEAMSTSDRRQISISVSEQAGWARVAIADTGRGIPSDLLTRVFEPGFTTKVDKGISRGLGLGLYAAHAIVQDHWGRIEVQSQIRQGSTFTVCLPAI